MAVMACGLGSCVFGSDWLDFSRAKSSDSSDAYRQYLSRAGDRTFQVEARQRLDEALFREATAAKEIGLLKRYLKEAPIGRHRAEVEDVLEGTLYTRAVESRSAGALAEYLDDAPKKRHEQEIVALLDDAIYEETTTKRTLRGVAAYRQRFPNGRNARAVQLLAEQLTRETLAAYATDAAGRGADPSAVRGLIALANHLPSNGGLRLRVGCEGRFVSSEGDPELITLDTAPELLAASDLQAAANQREGGIAAWLAGALKARLPEVLESASSSSEPEGTPELRVSYRVTHDMEHYFSIGPAQRRVSSIKVRWGLWLLLPGSEPARPLASFSTAPGQSISVPYSRGSLGPQNRDVGTVLVGQAFDEARSEIARRLGVVL